LAAENVRVPAPVFVSEPEPESAPENVAARALVWIVEEFESVAGTEVVRAEPFTWRVPPARLTVAVPPSLRMPSVPPTRSVPPELTWSVPVPPPTPKRTVPAVAVAPVSTESVPEPPRAPRKRLFVVSVEPVPLTLPVPEPKLTPKAMEAVALAVAPPVSARLPEAGLPNSR
jgi:hypothetical protein